MFIPGENNSFDGLMVDALMLSAKRIVNFANDRLIHVQRVMRISKKQLSKANAEASRTRKGLDRAEAEHSRASTLSQGATCADDRSERYPLMKYNGSPLNRLNTSLR